MTQDLLALMRHLGIPRIDLAGNSMGGVIGLEVIKQAPEALRSLTTFGTTYQLAFPKFTVTVQNVLYQLIGPKLLPDYIAKLSTKYDHARPVIRAQFRGMDFDVVRCMRCNIHQYDYVDVAANWNKPILLIKGSLDRAIKLRSTLEALGDCEHFSLVRIEGAGHFANLDKPQEYRESLSGFLSKID